MDWNPLHMMPVDESSLSLVMGKTILIEYTDRNGDTTTRKVTPKAFTSFHGHRAIRAYCHLRNDDRSFLLTRIRRCSCTEWPALEAQRRLRVGRGAIGAVAPPPERVPAIQPKALSPKPGCGSLCLVAAIAILVAARFLTAFLQF